MLVKQPVPPWSPRLDTAMLAFHWTNSFIFLLKALRAVTSPTFRNASSPPAGQMTCQIDGKGRRSAVSSQKRFKRLQTPLKVQEPCRVSVIMLSAAQWPAASVHLTTSFSRAAQKQNSAAKSYYGLPSRPMDASIDQIAHEASCMRRMSGRLVKESVSVSALAI